jgi:hypothetical protein
MNPTATDVFDLNASVTFSGAADDPISSVSLVADDQFELATVPVASGQWSFDRAFSSPGNRKITARGLDASGVELDQAVVRVVVRSPVTTCEPRNQVFTIGANNPIPVFKLAGSSALFFRAGMTIDADGSPHAYHPNGHSGLDALANAMNGSKFVGVVTNASGDPVVQGPNDPAPGFFVSPTSLADASISSRRDPRRYVNSETVPYIALSGAAKMQNLVTLGDFVAVYNGHTDKLAFAIYADIGPRSRLGEGSIALAEALNIPSSPRIGGEEKRRILYVVFAGSRTAFGQLWNRNEGVDVINEQASALFEQWGGLPRIKACLAELG